MDLKPKEVHSQLRRFGEFWEGDEEGFVLDFQGWVKVSSDMGSVQPQGIRTKTEGQATVIGWEEDH